MKLRHLVPIGVLVGAAYALIWGTASTSPGADVSAFVPFLLLTGGAIGAVAGGVGSVTAAGLGAASATRPLGVALLSGFASAFATALCALALPMLEPAARLPLGLPAAAIALVTVTAYSWRRSHGGHRGKAATPVRRVSPTS